MRIVTLSLFLTIIMVSCKNEKQVSGAYVKTPTKHIIDSLYLYSDTVYRTEYGINTYKFKQFIYNKETKKLLLVHEGSWRMRSGNITFLNFYYSNEYDADKKRFTDEFISTSSGGFTGIFIEDDIRWDDFIIYKKVR